MSPGPYMNEDGDWWVPVDGTPFRTARRKVVSCLSYDIPDDGTLVYRGKVTTGLTEHEVGCDCEPSCYRQVLAYHFRENRRW